MAVTAGRLVQLVPVEAKAKPGKAFTAKLKVSGSHGTVVYAESKGAPQLKVSTSGVISAPATLIAGVYRASGNDRDTLGDSGTWAFTLTISGRKLTQAQPARATIAAGTAFKDKLKVKASHGKVTFTELKGAPRLKVTSSGVISAPATLKKGIYKATGTMKDSSGGSGSWRFTLTVTSGSFKQIGATTGTTTNTKAFTAQLKVAGAAGTVRFKKLTGSSQIAVSSSGTVSAPVALAAGTYTITGTAKDTSGDVCNWTFTLSVTSSVAP